MKFNLGEKEMKSSHIVIAIIIIVAIGLADTTKENILENDPPQQQKISNMNNTFSDNMYKIKEDMRYIGRNFNSYNNDADKIEKQLAVFHCGIDVVESAWKNHTYEIKNYENWREKDWKAELPYSTQEFIKNNINTPYYQIK